MTNIITLIVIGIIIVGIVAYYRQVKTTGRTRRALGQDNIIIVPSSNHKNVYQIWDRDTKEILSIAKDLDDGLREYIIYVNNKAVRTILDNANEVLKICSIDENGNIYNRDNEIEGNLKEYKWIKL